jgi:N-acetylglucosaminyldiphosphoundecaprenol N-acetyl-beta-D-mannosaminyltransferase
MWGTPHHSGRRGSINQIRQKIVEASLSSLMHQNLLINGGAGPINAADGGGVARLGPVLEVAGKNAGPACASHDSRDLAAYTQHRQATHPTLVDDLSREVYCMLGIPVDDIRMPSTVERIEAAIANKRPFLLSTPNLNFLMNSQSDASFRETLVFSDLCPPDGMPLLWIGRLIGIPLGERVAGADILEALQSKRSVQHPPKLFLFGGAEGIAAKAAQVINSVSGGLSCVGVLYPGFDSAQQMSSEKMISEINVSDADFLVVALGAKKGQSWLRRNHGRLTIPVRAHLGATMNFYAGTITRAPLFFRRLGLEWLWRIKEEPMLWSRYLRDGIRLATLMFSSVLPLVIWVLWLRLKDDYRDENLTITGTQDSQFYTISIRGPATRPHANRIGAAFRAAAESNNRIIVNFSEAIAIDARVLGLLLMLLKKINLKGGKLIFTGISPRLSMLFRLYGMDPSPFSEDVGNSGFSSGKQDVSAAIEYSTL